MQLRAALCLWILSLMATASAQVPGFEVPHDPTSAQCQLEQSRLKPQFGELLARYRQLHQRPTVAGLVALDTELRALLDARRADCAQDQALWVPEWQELGLAQGYMGSIGYIGKLLAEAHRIDPHSPYREYTLYSTMSAGNDVNAPGDLGVTPDPETAKLYLSEFPDGPFAGAADLHLAMFYKDLYMALRDGPVVADYHYDCMRGYVTGERVNAQQRRAQQRALHYYRRGFARRAPTQDQRALVGEIASGKVTGWSFCAD